MSRSPRHNRAGLKTCATPGFETARRSSHTMNRRQFLALSSAAVAAGPLRMRLSGQAPVPPQPRFEAIRRNVGCFTARGGTIGWLSNTDALVTVDTQFPDTAKLAVDGLRERAGGRGID